MNCELLTRLHELVSSHLSRPYSAISNRNKESNGSLLSNSSYTGLTGNSSSRKEQNAEEEPERLRRLNTERDLSGTRRNTNAEDDLLFSYIASTRPPLVLDNTCLFSGTLDGSETDWDAFAYALDLPQ